MPNEIKSSFPRLWKYSGERTLTLKADEWLEDKRTDDNIPQNLWRVHDKLYDLKKFAQIHPGGSDWINLTQGTDITEAFESAHMKNVEKVENLLNSFYKKPATTPRNSPYTFDDHGFYKTIKRRAEPILLKHGTGPTRMTLLIQDLVAVFFIVTAIVGVKMESICVKIMAGILLSMCMTCAHNFVHIRDNWRKFYFDLSILSSYELRVMHSLSHHMYPNTLLDMETTVVETPFPFLPNNKKNWVQRYVCNVYCHLAFVAAYSPIFMRRSWEIVTSTGASLRIENTLPYFELIVFIGCSNSFVTALVSWLIIHGTCCYVFSVAALLAGHHHNESIHDGDAPRDPPDFGLCQLDATMKSDWDHQHGGRTNFLILLLKLCFFQDHTMHHLFPTVCHSKLYLLEPMVQNTLAEFGVNYKSYDFFQLALGVSRQCRRNAPYKIRPEGVKIS